MSARQGWSRTRRAIRGIRRMSRQEWLTTFHSLTVMTFVELTVRWVPLPRLSRALGVPLRLGPDTADEGELVFDDFDPRTRRQLVCTWRVAAVWPFSDGPCLRRTLTGGHLIRRLHPELRLGVVGDGEGVFAHAWLELEGLPLEQLSNLQSFQNVPNGERP